MNTDLIAAHLQFLRKSHSDTQDELATKLEITRQAVSKWETGATIPSPDVLLKLSKLYEISINDILEPQVKPQRIADFEEIMTVSEKELKEILGQIDKESLVIALMGASPDANGYLEKVFPEIDFEKTRNKIGRVRIEAVEQAQEEIVAMINLWAVEGKMRT